MPSSASQFILHDWDYSDAESRATFRYSTDQGHRFEESLCFRGAPQSFNESQKAALSAVLDQLHIALGISYFKAFNPPQVIRQSRPFTQDEKQFFEKLYRLGLAEYAYRNQVSLDDLEFVGNGPSQSTIPHQLSPGIVVPIGGGKDSLLTVDLVQKSNQPFSVFSVGNHGMLHGMAEFLSLPYINVRRTISPLLLELNQQGALNGHVPISALIVFILAASAVIYDFDTAIVSHEASSNSENLIVDGRSINHQYSKSLEFELDFQAYLKTFLPEFKYFSLLRPLGELQILERFSKLSHYHTQFSSCNGNFKITKAASVKWCCDCPKCRFTFLGLAAFMSPSELLNIFGSNILDDPAQTTGFNELIGWTEHKPFECVGTYEESLCAFVMLTENSDWKNCYQVKRFAQDILPSLEDVEGLRSKALQTMGKASIPDSFEALLYAA
ncbi:MAG: hypothetical protein KDD62_08465 [Bdellovibrionales bacterium]|nr:hypothetical protein [Bdellovibrionales bacterium]